MADKDPSGAEDKLALPSLFGRKRGSSAPADEPTPDPVADPVAEPVTDTAPPERPAEETAVLTPVAPEPAPEPEPSPSTRSAAPAAPAAPAADTVAEAPAAPAPAPARAGSRKAEKAPRERPRLPALGAATAALVVGAAVGLLGVLLTFVSLQACDALTGTDSCGGPGLLVVLAVVVVMIFAGKAALAAFGVPESGGLSFLGVAVFVAVCLVFLVEQLLEPWMVVVGPVLCALGYGAAYWLVNRFNTELLEEEGAEPHDVR